MDVTAVSSAGQARELNGFWDVILADYHLGSEETGLDLLAEFAGRAPVRALVTANPSDATVSMASRMGIELIRKPLAPASLRAFLNRSLYSVDAADTP